MGSGAILLVTLSLLSDAAVLAISGLVRDGEALFEPESYVERSAASGDKS